jgi:ubiquinone biosynthesis monooxygenase Coq6
VLIEAKKSGQDLGHPLVLQRYAAERYAPNTLMLSACDALHHLFGNANPWIGALRSFGLNQFNRLDALKQSTMKYAMGA